MKKWFKECPFCANEIKEKAIKCQYCWEFLPKEEEKKKEPKKKAKKEMKECPFCLNKIDAEATKCPICEENLEWKAMEKISKPKINNIKRYKNMYLWIAWLVIIDIIFFCNVHLSAFRWWECFGSAIIRYVILILVWWAIIKNTFKEVEDNPTKTKLTAWILYFLWYITLALIIGYFWRF